MFLIIKLCLILCWEQMNLLANKKSTQREQVYTIITIQVVPNMSKAFDKINHYGSSIRLMERKAPAPFLHALIN